MCEPVRYQIFVNVGERFYSVSRELAEKHNIIRVGVYRIFAAAKLQFKVCFILGQNFRDAARKLAPLFSSVGCNAVSRHKLYLVAESRRFFTALAAVIAPSEISFV